MTAAVRSRTVAARVHWALLPYAHPRPDADERADGAIWHWWWLLAYWAMKLVERLPSAALFEPYESAVCTCPRCEGYEATYHTFEGECSERTDPVPQPGGD